MTVLLAYSGVALGVIVMYAGAVKLLRSRWVSPTVTNEKPAPDHTPTDVEFREMIRESIALHPEDRDELAQAIRQRLRDEMARGSLRLELVEDDETDSPDPA